MLHCVIYMLSFETKRSSRWGWLPNVYIKKKAKRDPTMFKKIARKVLWIVYVSCISCIQNDGLKHKIDMKKIKSLRVKINHYIPMVKRWTAAGEVNYVGVLNNTQPEQKRRDKEITQIKTDGMRMKIVSHTTR